jgi:translation initiation factor 3 subunit E
MSTTGTASAPATAAAPALAQFDLTFRVAPYLDRHLVLPLLEHVQKIKIYDEKQVLEAKLDLLMKTNLVDFAKEIIQGMTGTASATDKERYDAMLKELAEKRPRVIATFGKLNKQDAAPILRVLDDQALLETLRQNRTFTMAHLEQHENVTPDSLENLYKLAKHLFDCGTYTKAAEYLQHYRALSTHADKNFSALWGKFAAEILKQNWNSALEDLKKLKEAIDTRNFGSPVIQLQHRTWLIHWGLFVFFNHPDGKSEIVDLFFQENSLSASRYLNAVQTTCPHILRYLTTAVLCNKKRRSVLKELIRAIQQESNVYRDPVTEFMECLYINFDFDTAQLKLRECEKVLSNDFFLMSSLEEFLENARLFIFETYCRIHQVIDIGMLAQKLNLDTTAAEKWIVNMIRNARLDAKIDSARNQVVMGTQHPSIYQQVIEKTKGLAFRTYMLSNGLENLQTPQ